MNADRKATRFAVWIICAIWFLPLSLWAQGFEVSGESSLSGNFTLTIFNGDSTYSTLVEKSNRGMFLFQGEVESPVLASLKHDAMSRPFYFYLENSEISITLNATRPELSVVRNSRSNSEYRYLMERYRNASDPNAFLRQYVKENPTSIYTSFVLHEQMSAIDEGVLRQMITQIADGGRHTYHYTLLRRWMRETPAVSEGSEMPDFAFLDKSKTRRTFYQERDTENATLILFSASWCDRCEQQLKESQRMIGSMPVKTLVIDIDDNPNRWDANYLKQLSVDHIPYFIMVDRQGVVVARDIRIWELDKVLKSMTSNKK